MNHPFVTVIIPTHNRCQMLQRCIKSVLNQTFDDFELIIVDDASSDGTRALIEIIKDRRLRYIRHEVNKGGPASRNTGIRSASADWIALLDDDDEWFPPKLELQVKKIKASSSAVGLIYTAAEVFDQQQQKVLSVTRPEFRGEVYQRVLLNTILASNTALVRKKCFEKVGLFDEQLKSCQDWDMWLRISEYYEFDYVDEVLTRVYMHGEQISTNFASLIPGRIKMVQKHWKEFQRYPEIMVVHLKRIGKLHCLNGTWPQAIEWFKKAIEVRPGEILKILAWLVLEFPFTKLSSRNKSFKRYVPFMDESTRGGLR